MYVCRSESEILSDMAQFNKYLSRVHLKTDQPIVSAMAPMQHNFCVFADEIEAVIKF